MLRLLFLFPLFLLLNLFYSFAQPSPGPVPCPKPTPDGPCAPVFAPYFYEDAINSYRFGINQLDNTNQIYYKNNYLYTLQFAPNMNSYIISIYNSDGTQVKILKPEVIQNSGSLYSFTVDNSGFIYVGGQGIVWKISNEGKLISSFQLKGEESFDYYTPYDLEVDSEGNIYVLDRYYKILVYTNQGTILYTINQQLDGYEIDYLAIAINGNDELVVNNNLLSAIEIYKNGEFISRFFTGFILSLSVDNESNIYGLEYMQSGEKVAISMYSTSGQLLAQQYTDDIYWMVGFSSGKIFSLVENEFLLHDLFTNEIITLVTREVEKTLYQPKAIANDINGNIYIVDKSKFTRVQVFNYKGDFIETFGVFHPDFHVNDIQIDLDSKVYMATNTGVYIFDNKQPLDTIVGNAKNLEIYNNEIYVYDDSNSEIKVYSKEFVLVRSYSNIYGEKFQITSAGKFAVLHAGQVIYYSNQGELIDFRMLPFRNYDKFFIDEFDRLYISNYNTLYILNLDLEILQEIWSSDGNTSLFINGVSAFNQRLYIAQEYLNQISIYSNLPGLELQDLNLSYLDWYSFLPANTTSGDRIFYNSRNNEIASLSFDNMLTINNAGIGLIEGSVLSSLTMRKSVSVFSMNIDKAPLRFTAYNATKEYGAPNPLFSVSHPFYSATIDGLRADDDLIEIDELPMITTEANETSTVGDYAISFTGGLDNNYDFEFTQGKLTITKAPLQLLADNKSREYGDANPEFTFQTIGFKNNDDVQDLDSAPELSTTATLTSPADTYPVTLNVGLDNNYYSIPANGNLTVTKAPLQVKAQNATRAYGEPNPSFGVSFEGFKNNDTQDILVGIPTPYSDADNSSPVGQYPIVFGNNTDSRYEYITTSAILTIEKANQQITFNDLPSPIDSDADPFSVFDYASSTSNLPITFSIVSGPATINGVQVTLTGQGGTVTVNATQLGNSNYNAAEPVSKSFEVNLITGTNEEPGSLTIYPNPAKDVLSISSTEGVKFQLLNSSGVPVVRHINSFLNEHLVSTETLTKGIYLLVLQTASGNKITRKISVVK